VRPSPTRGPSPADPAAANAYGATAGHDASSPDGYTATAGHDASSPHDHTAAAGHDASPGNSSAAAELRFGARDLFVGHPF
jgi:hypothetical protein